MPMAKSHNKIPFCQLNRTRSTKLIELKFHNAFESETTVDRVCECIFIKYRPTIIKRGSRRRYCFCCAQISQSRRNESEKQLRKQHQHQHQHYRHMHKTSRSTNAATEYWFLFVTEAGSIGIGSQQQFYYTDRPLRL